MAAAIAQVGKAMGPKDLHADAWENCYTGVGTRRDKSTYSKWVPGSLLQPEYLDGVYAHNDIAQTIVDAIVDDALREGIEIRKVKKEGDKPDPSAEEKASEHLAKFRELHVQEAVTEGAKWGRLYGDRSGILIVAKGAGMAEKPMAPDAQGEILDLVVVDRRELQPKTWYQDPLEAKFGQPETYHLQVTAWGGAVSEPIIVHESRLILFKGKRAPKRVKQVNDGCDLSVLQAVWDICKKVEANFDAVCASLQDMSQGVIKMKGLIEAIAAGKAQDISDRIALMDQLRSVVRSLLLDADGEEFSYVERAALSGIADLLDASWTRLAKAADMPVTRLMGISPAGMNATGESDRKFWYDRVRAYQRDILKPAFDRLLKMIAGEGWEVCFPDLEKQDPLEEAQLQQAQAQTDKIYFDIGSLTPSEIAKVRFGKGHWSGGYDGIDMEPHEAALERELAELEEGPPEPEIDPATGLPVAPLAPGAPPGNPGAKPPVADPDADPKAKKEPPPEAP